MLAARLGLRYLDTGAMYRAVALAASRAGIDVGEVDRLTELAAHIEIGFADGEPGQPQRILLNGEDVTEAIRRPEISELASAISAHSPVRAVLVDQQKAIVRNGGYTLEGRDTTTVVAPHAQIRVFLTASLEERAKRRHRELIEKGTDIAYDDLLKQMMERDHRDYTRDDSPLTVADGAIVLESFGIPPEVIADQIVAAVQELAHQ